MPKVKFTCLDETDEGEEEQITTTYGNKIFFYDTITKKNILNLFIEVERLNNKLAQESQLYNFSPIIELHIHSSGGELYAGVSAYDRLKNNKIPIHTIIEGEACSAATLIALAGKKRYITENSMILIHQIRTWFSGKHNDLEDEMKTANKLMDNLIGIYTMHTNMKETKLQQIIRREEYLTAQECLKMGFVDEIL